MDDHHVVDEQHADPHGQPGTAGQVSAQGIAFDLSSRVSR